MATSVATAAEAAAASAAARLGLTASTTGDEETGGSLPNATSPPSNAISGARCAGNSAAASDMGAGFWQEIPAASAAAERPMPAGNAMVI